MDSRDRKYAGVLALNRARTGGRRRSERPRDGSRLGSFGRIGKLVAVLTAFLTLVLVTTPAMTAQAVTPTPDGTVGNGFTVTPGDLAFILKQIKIAERHSRAYEGHADAPTPPVNPNKDTDPEYCLSMIGPASDQIPDAITSYGLRTVDGQCNNLKALANATKGFNNPSTFGASDQPFPRLTTPVFSKAEPITPDFPVGPPGPTSYAQKLAGNVVIDSQPRVVSNLIDDQTSTNPAAIAAAEFPVRTQGNPGLFPCTTEPAPTAVPPTAGVPAGCVPAHKTLFIPNVTTDVGLSPPYNSLFTFFGQFFDHGVDQTVKSGGTVFVPLRADDPLVTLGPDGIANSGDEVPPSQAFMVLTRAQNQPGPDGILGTADDIQDPNNTDTPWVDQSQTYTSHPSHQVFLREYEMNAANHPVSTGKLLGGLPAGQTYLNSPDGQDGIGTWAAVKLQAASKLGLLLKDKDVTNVPMLAVDPYGNFIPDPLTGLPDYVTTTGLVSGNLANPVAVPANVKYFDTPFVADIAHNADPSPQTDPATGAVTIPVPDADNTPSADFAHQPVGTYDDEMLNAHFACGDGRCNENIALSSIHQVFHSEHDRLVDYIKNVLTTDTSAAGIAALPEWQLPTAQSPDGWNGSRLFQAARFVTEMEYQHLVFEEFARKVQPAIRPFHVYSPDINPAIEDEFAQAVYRFGHSMLDDDVARTNVDPATGAKTDNSIPLLTAFLNPPEYFERDAKHPGTTPPLTPREAAGSVIMGSSDQVGNELDEFVTETLRNNLLGLPLDLPTINMARARESGIPPLNEVRRQIFAQTNDGQLAPYTSWSDFGQHLKHPESLINFVAAYGTHPTIRDSGPDGVLGTADDVTTIAGKRAAAKAIVDPAVGVTPPADAADFMFGTGAWASGANGVTKTGLDSVDLWVGGLAEVTNLNGGLLGSTFNYVFETQLEKLQDGDRLYYLARTPGLNLRSQLEGNSFSELIQRNTAGTNTLKADAFATADCKFQLGNLAGTAAGFATFGATVADDPSTTDCDESKLLLRKPDGTIQYRAINSVDPSGINGQSVYNGTPGDDRVFGGNDNDTFWGGDGNDVIEGGGGDDVALGGNGNDIITDLAGADVLKGGPGNDAIDGGIGDDILLGADGADFLNGGANDNEEFAGPGNDFIIAGQGADAVFGDGGDDWIEGGTGQDLLQGDHGAPFFDDPGETAPGNDFFIGQPGENDYDAEGGDDVMAQNAAIDRNAGAGGFDWAFHQYDTTAANDDMMINNNLNGLPIQLVVNRDRWQETEADSGSSLNDTIKGTDGVLATPRLIGGAGFQGCDALDQAGVARISGLAALLPPVSAWLGTAAETAALSTQGICPLNGPVWGEGDILLGGAGNDTFTGRNGDDIIDGDKELRIAISVRTDPKDPTTEIGRTDLMEDKATSGKFDNLVGNPSAGMTLQQAVFAGLVDPGNLVAVREIASSVTTPGDCFEAAPVNCDTSVYSGPRSQYTITTNANGSVTVVDSTTATPAVVGAEPVGDGTDTLWNIERLQFTDSVVNLAPVSALSTTSVAFGTVTTGGSALRSVTITNTGTRPLVFASAGLSGPDAGQFSTTTTCTTVAPAASCTVSVRFSPTSVGAKTASLNITTNASSVPQVVSLTGTGAAPATAPNAPTIGTATAGNASATVRWTAPANNGGSAITSFSVKVLNGAGVQVGALRTAAAGATSLVVTGLANGTAVHFQVAAVNAIGTSAFSGSSNAVTPAAPAPGAPTLGALVAGSARVTVNWTAPAGGGVTGYDVRVVTAASVTLAAPAGVQVGALRSTGGAATSVAVTGLANGTAYRFQVRAKNNTVPPELLGPYTALSASVTPAVVPTVPVAPVLLSGQPGPAGTPLTVGANFFRVAANSGNSPLLGYRIIATNTVAGSPDIIGPVVLTPAVAAGGAGLLGARTLQSLALPAGTYTVRVVAVNAVGNSLRSNAATVVAR
jgi:Ca2+-binding RTX toxin-like protein